MQSALSERATVPDLDRPEDFAAGDAAVLEAQIERLKPQLRLAVIFGGNNATPGSVVYASHNTRSWKSYEAVAADIASSLRRIGFRHVSLMPDDMDLGERLRGEGIHMAWLNTGGIQGYNPAAHAPSMLEMFGLPYVGHDPLTATTLDNKHAFKREALCAGLPTAAFATWHMARGPFRPAINSRFQLAFGDYPGPFVVKPVSGRASLHVHVVEDRAALPDAVAEVYRATANVVLIEKYLPGREFCIAVAGPVTARAGRLRRRNDPFTFAAVERVLSSDEKIFTSMDVRPITRDRCRSLDATHEPALVGEMHQLARDVYLEFNLGSLVRLDLRTDENGDLNILEANPKPDLKQPTDEVTSLISTGLSESGLEYDDLVLSLLADRVDFLLTHRRETVRHIVELLHPEQRPGVGGGADTASGAATRTYRQVALETATAEEKARSLNRVAAGMTDRCSDGVVAGLNEAAHEANVKALNAVLPSLRREGGSRSAEPARPRDGASGALSEVS
jgi:D-alanine-D-alanine ligase